MNADHAHRRLLFAFLVHVCKEIVKHISDALELVVVINGYYGLLAVLVYLDLKNYVLVLVGSVKRSHSKISNTVVLKLSKKLELCVVSILYWQADSLSPSYLGSQNWKEVDGRLGNHHFKQVSWVILFRV